MARKAVGAGKTTIESPESGAAIPERVHLNRIKIEELGEGRSLLQSSFWAEFKKAAGWKGFAYSWDFMGCNGRFLVLERRLLRFFSMAYIPYGPFIPAELGSEERNRFFESIARKLKTDLFHRCFLLRFDLDSRKFSRQPDLPLRRSPYRVQPQDTVILKLDKDKNSLLADMHKKTRYNIRLSEKKGVEISRYTGSRAIEMLDVWYELYRETSVRDGITVHPITYYHRLFKLASGSAETDPVISLYMAVHEGEALAGIIVSHWGNRATYMYGASGSHKRSLMPNHLLQWHAIMTAQDEGLLEYDFFGIPPADDPTHPMHGLWRFKTGFGGEIVHYEGAWDYPYCSFIYTLYRSAERLRGKLAALRKRRSR